jgi:site-specific DNA recombinase
MRKAILYIRVSTDEQAEKGFSLKHQEERLRTYCEQNNIHVAAFYKEDFSAKSFERPEFQKMLLFLKKNKGIADLLLFTKWDRFSRNAPDAYAMLNQLNKLSVEAQGIEQPLDLSIPENKIMLGLYLIAPEVENDRRSLNTIMGMRRAGKEGRWTNRAPYGYRNIHDVNGKPIIVPSKDADTIRFAFDMLAKGVCEIEGVRKMVNLKGVPVSKSRFWCLIRNPVYCGKIYIPAWKDEPASLVKAIHEPIIPEGLFYDVQDVLNGRKKNFPTKNTKRDEMPLRGFLICRKCGGIMTGSGSQGNGGKYFYYHCQTKSGCNERIKAEQANVAMLKQLDEIEVKNYVFDLYEVLLLDKFKQGKTDKAKLLTEIQSEIDKVNLRIKNAQTLMLDGAIDSSEYREIKSSLVPEIERLERKKVSIADEAEDYSGYISKGMPILRNISKYYKDADLEGRQGLIGSIFPEKVIFDENKYRTIEPNPILTLITFTGAGSGGNKKGKSGNNSNSSLSVPRTGIEPALPCDNQILSLARLPIPPSGPFVRRHDSGAVCR